MTAASLWRLRWLVEAERGAADLRTRLRQADAGDARRLRAMLGELREALAHVRSAALLENDHGAVAELTGTNGGEARALALRLRGRPWTEALAGLSRSASRTVRQAWADLCRRLLTPGRAAGEQAPAAPASAPSAAAGTACRERAALPSAATSSLEHWIGRTSDLERTARLLKVFRRGGMLPAPVEVEPIDRTGCLAGIAGYLLVRAAPPAAAVWSLLRRCGLRLLGPAPVGA